MTLKLKPGEKFYSNKTNEYLWQEQSKGLNVEARSFILLKFLWNYEWRKIELTTVHPFLVIAIAGKCKVPCEVSKHHLVVTGHVGGWPGLHISCYKSLHCLRVPAGDISTRLMVNRPKERHPGNHNIMTSTHCKSWHLENNISISWVILLYWDLID